MLLIDLTVFDLKVNDKIYNQGTKETGVINDIRETAYEWVDAFIVWPDGSEEILELHDKDLYLIK